MSNLWFNIRFGITHYQMTSDWKFFKRDNPHHIGSSKKFEVYCLFGIHF
ncbi:hypothetical protein NVP1121O_200 [Vibrio phage 1.121.O._10N.286.46.C4]|nr:hypothetical protein NVP1121O_200 [Vibrio phage 1.121.O._10N.286.46.C4]